MKPMSTMSVLAVLLASTALSSVSMAQTARLVPLGVLDERGNTSYAYGLSSDGRFIVGGAFVAGEFAPGMRACRWVLSATGEIQGPLVLPATITPTDFSSVALAVSDDGERVVGSIGLVQEFFFGPLYSAYHGAYWWGVEGPAKTADWIPEVLEFSDVAADGSAVVGTTRGPSFEPIPGEPVRWLGPGQKLELLGSLGANGQGFACSADGAIAVGESFNAKANAVTSFIWDAPGGIRQLPNTPSDFNTAMAMSPDARFVVGGLVADAAWWSEATGMINIGRHPRSSFAYALDVSADGSVAVGYSVTDNETRTLDAFVWDATHGMRTLAEMLAQDHGVDTAGWHFQSATAISDDARTIIGYATTPSNRTEGFAIQLGGPECRADFDGDGVVNSADFFAYLVAFFNGAKAADFNRDGTVNSQDFFDFLGAFFVGC